MRGWLRIHEGWLWALLFAATATGCGVVAWRSAHVKPADEAQQRSHVVGLKKPCLGSRRCWTTIVVARGTRADVWVILPKNP